MVTRTLHVYRSPDGVWTVKKEGKPAHTFSTRREAVDAARKKIRLEKRAQFVVYGEDGQIREHGVHGMPRILYHPKKSPLAEEIGRVVGRMALERVQSDFPR